MPEREGAERAARIELVQARISKKHEGRDDANTENGDQNDHLRRVAADHRRPPAVSRDRDSHSSHRCLALSLEASVTRFLAWSITWRKAPGTTPATSAGPSSSLLARCNFLSD